MTRIIVKACGGREENQAYLQRHLPDLEWCRDRHRDAWETFVRALEMAGRDACVHMEDDVILTQGFRDKVEAEIAARPDRVLQFFSMRGDDKKVGSRFDRTFIANLCTYYPPDYSRKLAGYAPVWPDRDLHPTGTDLMVRDWLRARKELYWIVVPNLVDHRVGQSLINPRRSSRRQSLTFRDPAE
jgi:hypothetical protein